MDYIIGKAIDVGLQRREKANQDSIEVMLPGIFNHNPPLLIVADGMGGYSGGALASKIVIKTLSAYYRQAKQPINYSETLRTAIQLAHKEMLKRAQGDAELSKMGSTVVAAVLENDMLYIANVGDSRAFLLNQERIRQISWDHSFVGELVRQKLITPAEASTHPKRNVLTMSISAQREDLEVYTNQLKLEKNDIVLLCSDGLWGPVSEAQIQAVAWEMPPQQASNKLVELANRNMGPDNISVIIARHKNNHPPLAAKVDRTSEEDTLP